MYIERIITFLKYRLALLPVLCALWATGCSSDEEIDAPYLYFGEKIESMIPKVFGSAEGALEKGDAALA